MPHVIRTLSLISAAALLAACGGGTDTPSSSSGAAVSTAAADDSYLRADDYILGNVDASVTLLEYASVACPACANWSKTVYPEIKSKYIDTGKVRYVFRPFPTNPIQVADTGHMLAYCGKDEDYYTNIKLQFDRQSQIIDMMRNGKGREAYISLAKASGLSEEEFIACLTNEDIRARYDDVVQQGQDMGVNGTPTFFVNGERVNAFTVEQLEEYILPALGEPAPSASSNDAAEDGATE